MRTLHTLLLSLLLLSYAFAQDRIVSMESRVDILSTCALSVSEDLQVRGYIPGLSTTLTRSFPLSTVYFGRSASVTSFSATTRTAGLTIENYYTRYTATEIQLTVVYRTYTSFPTNPVISLYFNVEGFIWGDSTYSSLRYATKSNIPTDNSQIIINFPSVWNVPYISPYYGSRIGYRVTMNTTYPSNDFVGRVDFTRQYRCDKQTTNGSSNAAIYGTIFPIVFVIVFVVLSTILSVIIRRRRLGKTISCWFCCRRSSGASHLYSPAVVTHPTAPTHPVIVPEEKLPEPTMQQQYAPPNGNTVIYGAPQPYVGGAYVAPAQQYGAPAPPATQQYGAPPAQYGAPQAYAQNAVVYTQPQTAPTYSYVAQQQQQQPMYMQPYAPPMEQQQYVQPNDNYYATNPQHLLNQAYTSQPPVNPEADSTPRI